MYDQCRIVGYLSSKSYAYTINIFIICLTLDYSSYIISISEDARMSCSITVLFVGIAVGRWWGRNGSSRNYY
jgi:hypothetical protein